MTTLAAPYRPRRPEDTVLYRVVHRHLETFIAYAAEEYDAPLPKYVRDELRGYLRCGIFEHGFTHARCDACGFSLLVAFSCKARGLCPSCAGRRMANTAAHLVDRVLPSVPVRQWVLSLPFHLRPRAAFDPRALTAMVRCFSRALAEHHRSWARGIGIDRAEIGAITFIQRFGSSLNLNVHLHVVVIDGVFSRDAAGRVEFTPSPPPTSSDLAAVLHRVRMRIEKALSKVNPVGGAHTPLASCAQLALGRGDVRQLPSVETTQSDEVAAPVHVGTPVDDNGFNLDASVRIDADDDFGREHLLRYCARPPLSLARLRELPDGRIAYRIKQLRSGKAKVRIMTPLELLARLAALIPPPRHPLIRFHGVLAPRSSWRASVIPKAPDKPSVHPTHEKPAPPLPTTSKSKSNRNRKSHASAALVPKAELLTPNVISLLHWQRLKHGALLARSTRIDWPTLLRRTFDTDVLECPKCTGRLKVMAIVEPPDTITVLDELNVPRATPPRRARDPTTLFAAPENFDLHAD